MKGRSIAALLSLTLGDAALAAQLQVEVRVSVQRGCLLVSHVRDGGVESLGTLDFGSAARLDDPQGPLSAQLSGQRLARLECNPDTAYQLQVDGGQHGGVGEVRYLGGPRAGTPAIPYTLYRDPARRVPLPVNQVLSGVVPSTGSVELPLYGRIQHLAQVPEAGEYSDLVKVTLSW
ncbi:MAG: spore coat U domain-containing protein [Pseudomonas sp.]|uniref:Csu type fimbrial protein n=1 Tax=Pseudomonas abieticivorans TaxID=2931382 RepID=UPI0020C0FD8A|nr:spore coat U domain-containing protein [Pseudomonas sp. PIA16]MDE1168054.1 spore coat U domain-containing protein [Pseudomonas sp.]